MNGYEDLGRLPTDELIRLFVTHATEYSAFDAPSGDVMCLITLHPMRQADA